MERYLQWLDMSKQLRALKGAEAKLRRELCEEVFKHGQNKGANYTFEHDGYRVKATDKKTKKIDEKVFNVIFPELSDLEKAAIKFKPSLIAAKFKVLGEDCLLMEAITESSGMPTLEIKKIEE